MFNYDFYIASIVVLGVLIAYYSTLSITRDLAAKCYGFFLVICFFACVTDVISGAVLMEYFSENVFINYLAQAISCSSLHLIPMVYFFYMRVLARKLEWFPKRCLLLAFLGVIEQILIYSTPWTGWIFTYSAQEGYARGPMMWFLIVAAMIYIALACIEIFLYGKELERRYQYVTAAFIVITMACLMIQMWDAYYVLLGAAAGVNCLIMQLTLYNPRMIEEAKVKEVEARKAAEEANLAKSSFLANMSHEIRTPMNAICGMAEILGESELRPLERDYVRTIQEASQSLLHIIDDVLDFSKIDADEMKLVEEDYSFEELITGVEDIISARLQGKRITFEINMGRNVPKIIRGDKMRVQQILINILGNAVKFTEEGKISLEIDFTPMDNGRLQIVFRVADTGIGIKRGDMGKLFNRFSQVDAKHNRKVQGTGLGLALSRKLARLMGGDVTVTSEYGVGSCFTIVIVQEEGIYYKDTQEAEKMKRFQAYIYERNPEVRWHLGRILTQIGVPAILLNSESQLQALAEETSDSGEDARKKVLFYTYEANNDLVDSLTNMDKKVPLLEYYSNQMSGNNLAHYLRRPLAVFKVGRAMLDDSMETRKENECRIRTRNVRAAVVDDNRVNVKVAMTLLQKFGISSEAFTSGMGIIRALEEGRTYDIIFMDHMMPEMNGVETARRIRELPGEYPKRAVIIALTANAIDGVEKEYQEAGMNDWLFKPVKLENLQEKLIKYLPPEKVVY